MTVEPLMSMLRSAALVGGIDPVVHVGQFNTWAQEILDTTSSFYHSNPDVAILAVQTRDIAPEIWEAYADLSPAEVQLAIERVFDAFSVSIHTFREHSKASLIVHLLEKPMPVEGVLAAQGSHGQLVTLDHLNLRIREICSRYRGVYALDYDALVAQHGRARWRDESKWLTMRMPFATESFLPLVSEWLKFLHPLTGVTCKVVAVDLDNTLWGGVLGEVGLEGIQIGREYPAAFYRSLQRVLLDLYHRGILLAVCSKNSSDEAVAALRHHPDMLLRPEHFAAFRINWQDKPQNLREIAAELNIGTDAIAFLDDSPVERERVRLEMPEVRIINLPDRPEGFANALRGCPLFERLALSQEEREHTRLYHEQRHRVELADRLVSLEDFYGSLQQQVSIAPATSDTIARIAQLTQKTNQYNVTTRRYTEQQIEDIASRPDWSVYSVNVKDRFGDNGIVGVLIVRMNDRVCEIDTFLLSCRVIGRTIETAMLGFLTETSKAESANFLRGWFNPTKKNDPVRELYSTHHFRAIDSVDDAVLWSLNLAEQDVCCPQWIHLQATRDSRRAERTRA
jgi:FkbH-like protein